MKALRVVPIILGTLIFASCSAEDHIQTQAQSQVKAKYQVTYTQEIKIDGTERTLVEFRNTETGDVFLVLQGSEMSPFTMVKE